MPTPAPRIRFIDDPEDRQRMVRAVLTALPEWFGIPEATEAYIRESAGQACFAALRGTEPVGFLCLKETGRATMELAVLGVLKPYHRQGIGTALFEAARDFARAHGYAFLQVKTVQMGRYPAYDATNRFYQHLGFQEFEVLPELWGEQNPCQIYVMAL